MAKGTKELKVRITGVKNIQQITGAMEMVATQKLKRLQMRAEAARPFSAKIQEMVGRLSGSVKPELSPLLGARDVKATATVVVTSDKGMCGAYNANIVRQVQGVLESATNTQRLYLLGNKGEVLLRARGIKPHKKFEDVVEKLDFTRVRGIAHELTKAFLDGEVDEVRLLYTAFLSAARQRPAMVTVLPIRPEELLAEGRDVADEKAATVDFIVEPDAEQLLRDLLPKFIEVKIYAAILQALASEFTFRRNAMKQATDAADDMIKALKRQYNRARQESITSQLLEISSGAEALK